MAARNAKRSISMILRENRGLWTVYQMFCLTIKLVLITWLTNLQIIAHNVSVGAEIKLQELRHNTSTFIKSWLHKSLSGHSKWFMPFEIYKLGIQKTNLYWKGLGCFHRSKRFHRFGVVAVLYVTAIQGYWIEWRQRLGMKQMIIV